MPLITPASGGPFSTRPPPSRGQKKIVWYEISIPYRAAEGRSLSLSFWQQVSTKAGAGKLKPLRFAASELGLFGESDDKEILALLTAITPQQQNYNSSYLPYGLSSFEGATLAPSGYDPVLAKLAETGRLGYFSVDLSSEKSLESFVPVSWDAGEPYQFTLELADEGTYWELKGCWTRGDRRRLPSDTVAVFSDGTILFRDTLARVEADLGAEWVTAILDENALLVPKKEEVTFLKKLASLRHLPPLQLPESLGFRVSTVKPLPVISLEAPEPGPGDKINAKLLLRYGDRALEFAAPPAGLLDVENRTWTLRDLNFEKTFFQQLLTMGFKSVGGHGKSAPSLQTSRKALFELVGRLIDIGCEVQMEKRILRPMRGFSSRVSSGMEWLELDGKAEFGDHSADLRDLFRALKKGERFLTLSDGSQGMIPEVWKKHWLPVLNLAEEVGGAFRFKPTQALLLDGLLSERDEVDWDAHFLKLLGKMKEATPLSNPELPRTFQGELRPYQVEGYAWLLYLQELGFGGCLADDMGLGKTIQVLALIEGERQTSGSGNGPLSVVVVPRSLVFNWISEAKRFTPKLRIAEFDKNKPVSTELDLLVITYGMLREHIEKLKDVPFHYVILDEAQAIKNPTSQSAKAARILQAKHRLVMTGTPVENHPSDLWSLFEFLNPGLLGSRHAFGNLFRGTKTTIVEIAESKETLKKIGQGLRPFILRRTKEAVLKDLPEKTEQFLYCDLEPAERKIYDETRDYYRTALEQQIKDSGWNQSQILLLEALLRLRQAACHPRLVRPEYDDETSAKTRLLLDRLEEIVESGHKVLVFSQFTTFLGLVRKQIQHREISHEYLDGKTRNREERVRSFQEDPGCKIFLLSLKAGGVGLNLTAADYVFLLDPWWNPAAEAQAIDRSHRIGQARPVFSYRLIARDTVEERILELQQHKSIIKDALIASDETQLKRLSAEDLSFLLG